MLSLQKLTKWMRGWLDTDATSELPEEVYNDVIPSGVHQFNHFMDT